MTKTYIDEVIARFDKVSKAGDWCGCYEGDLGDWFPKQQKKVKAWIAQEIKQAEDRTRQEASFRGLHCFGCPGISESCKGLTITINGLKEKANNG